MVNQELAVCSGVVLSQQEEEVFATATAWNADAGIQAASIKKTGLVAPAFFVFLKPVTCGYRLDMAKLAGGSSNQLQQDRRNALGYLPD